MTMSRILAAGLVAVSASAATADILTGTIGSNVVIVAEPIDGAAVVLDAPAQSSLAVTGCGADGWCQVETSGTIGWVRADAVNLTANGETFLLAAPPASVQVAVLEPTPVVVADPVMAYIAANPLTSITFSGDIALGDELPDTVVLTPVPDSDLRYVYIQDAPVIVGADGRVIAIAR